jgi:CheY-like chemotaxis protein/signal transduction histidine kinase
MIFTSPWIPTLSPALFTVPGDSPLLIAGLGYLLCVAVVGGGWMLRQVFLARRQMWTMRAAEAARLRDPSFLIELLEQSEFRHHVGDLSGVLAGFDERIERHEEARCELESRLEKQREKRSLPFDALPGTWFILDEEQRFREVSRRFCEYLGSPEDDLVGTLLSTVLLQEAPAVGPRQEVTVKRAGGWDRPASLLLSDEQRDGSRIAFLVDAEAPVPDKKEEADLGPSGRSEAMEAMADLAGSVARDFNDQLTAILGHGAMLLSLLDEDDPHRSSVEEIAAAGERARLLTRQLLAFSRREVARPESLDPHLLIREREPALRALVGDGVELDFQLGAEGSGVRFDPIHLHLVLKSLVQNASEAMNGLGRIRIQTAVVERLPDDGQGAVRDHERSGSWVRLRVSDSGPGMSREGLDRMFEPYFTTRRREGRRGMGLSAVYGFVCQNHGRIAVANAPERGLEGTGLVVEVFLPMAVAVSPSVVLASSPIPEAGCRPTVCVVEDDPQVRRLLSIVLEREEIEVLLAENGQEALDLLEERGSMVDLVLTDVNMPVVGGVELAGEVRRRFPGIEVLFMSGFIEDDVFRSGLSESSNSLLQKPFTPKTLLEHVRRGLAGAGAEPANSARVLVVDDEEGIREMLQALIESFGHVCRLAESGDEAIEVLNKEAADIVISDMIMPGKDGIQTCIAIRRLFPDTRIIAMSGKIGRGSNLAAAERLGAVASLAKPFSRDELRLALERALE